ncbi:MAG: hypothetical protein ACI4NN_06315 [Pyramidobacter sp.]
MKELLSLYICLYICGQAAVFSCCMKQPKARLIVLSRRASDFFQRLSSDESISDFQSLDRIHNICVLSFFIGVVSSETAVSVLSGRRPGAFFRILLSFCQEVPGRMRPGSVYYTRQGAGTSSAPDAGSAVGCFPAGFLFLPPVTGGFFTEAFCCIEKKFGKLQVEFEHS